MSKLQITFYSGVGTVTGANFMLESLKTRILVDCGLIQGTPDAYLENKKPFEYDPKSVDFLFVTHAHMDHIGRVCKLVKDGFNGIIYSTLETKTLANIMIADALKVMSLKEKESKQTMEDGDTSIKEEPLFSLNDFNKTMALWRTLPYYEKSKVSEDFDVLLKDAGHILGSSMYEFYFEGKKIVFTGDSGNSPAPLLKDTDKITDADFLVVDSVYGDRNHEDKDYRDKRFKQVLLDTIAKGGALVIPAFSIERTQVILYTLNNLIEEKLIPSIPVFLDSPLALKVTDVYKHFIKDFNKEVKNEISSGDNIFSFPKLNIIHSREESGDIVKTPNPKIIIAGSGMSSGGRVVGHEVQFLPDPNSTILLMGYQAIGTLGRRIQDKPAYVEINGQNIPVRARIENITGYSSHKDSDGIVDMVSNTASTVKKVFVVMGEPKSALFLAQRLRDELGVSVTYPEQGINYKLF